MKNKQIACVVLGGGGHARVLIDCIKDSKIADPCVILDADQSLWGQFLMDVPVLGGDDRLPEVIRMGISHFVVGLGGVGDNLPRRCLFEWGLQNGLIPLNVRHSSAICSKWAEMGPGSQLLSGSIVNTRAKLGTNVIVNSGAIVEHDCVISDHVHIATGSRLAGAVSVGACAHIGAGATVLNCVSIGENSIIGAGAVVVDDVPDNVVVVGVPARMIRRKYPVQ